MIGEKFWAYPLSKLIHTDATENEGLWAVSFRCQNQLMKCEVEYVG